MQAQSGLTHTNNFQFRHLLVVKKNSGMGREKGRNGIRAFMSQKSLYFDLTGNSHPWAET